MQRLRCLLELIGFGGGWFVVLGVGGWGGVGWYIEGVDNVRDKSLCSMDGRWCEMMMLEVLLII